MAKEDGWWTRLRRRFGPTAPPVPAPCDRAHPALPAPEGPRNAAMTEPAADRPPHPATKRPRKRRPPTATPAVIALPDRDATARPTAGGRPIALALQGGGAHGAFTWGVLDRLLEEDGLDIAAVSGASAGAMNGAMLLRGWGAGHRDGPRAGARAALDRFWNRVSTTGGGLMAPIRPTVLDRLAGNWNVDHSPYSRMFESARRMVTPYDVQPPDYHPMRRLLTELVDVEAIRRAGIRLFVAAANVRTGRLRLFDETEVGVEALLASACLPSLFQAIGIDGEHYWDGGYLANPALFPLRRAAPAADVVLVSLSPLTCPDVPRDVAGITARLGDLTFNAVLMRELEEFMEEASGAGSGGGRGGAARLHHIEAEDALRALGHHSKMMTDVKFLSMLRELGRDAADRWLARHLDDVGARSTFAFAPERPATVGTLLPAD